MRLKPMARFVGMSATFCSGSMMAPVTQAQVGPNSAHSKHATGECKAPDQLLAGAWQYQLIEGAEVATTIVNYRHDDRGTDYSLAHITVTRSATASLLKRFKAVNPQRLDEHRSLSLKMMEHQLHDQLEGNRLKNYELPMDQIPGVHIMLPGFVATIPFDNVQQFEDYIKRPNALPKVLADRHPVSAQGMKDELAQPKYLLEKVVDQLNQITNPAGVDNAFSQPVASFPDGMPKAGQIPLRKEILATVNDVVLSAFLKMAVWTANEDTPNARVNEEAWPLSKDDERYRFAIETLTTTYLMAALIHQKGLESVKEIEGQMTVIAHQIAFTDLARVRASVAKNLKMFATSREQILDLYRHDIAGLLPEQKRSFGHRRRTERMVQAVARDPEHGASAEYHPRTPDESRPGVVFVDPNNDRNRRLYDIQNTACHEGVPCHNLQRSIAQQLRLPPVRQKAACNAYIEGRPLLHTKRLAKEVGYYKYPCSDYGRRGNELLRADRMVLNFSVHYLHLARA